MKTLTTKLLLAIGALSLASMSVAPAQAAGPAAKKRRHGSIEVARCPKIAWRIAKAADGTLRGIMWYDDMSGLSKATGTAEDGKFHLTMTSIEGQGPTGTADGERSSNGSGEARMVGAGCANMTVKMQPIQVWGGTG